MSHKLGCAAVAYELVTCIATGDIVAYNGPFPAGKWPDLKIFRNKTKWQLQRAEWAVGDRGYKGDRKILNPVDAKNRQHSYGMECVRARHKTVNRCLRRWTALHGPYRHCRHKHHLIFRAIVVITQIKFENGSAPFPINHYMDPVIF